MAAEQRIVESGHAEHPMPFLDRIREFIFASLREERPYMKIDTVHDVLTATINTLEQKIKDQESAEEDTKQRCSFMSLSPELRLRICLLVLQPENDGDGGVNGCRAIFIGAENVQVMENPALGFNGYRMTTWVQQPPITMLNRQTRSETLPVYYGRNNFVLEVRGPWLRRPLINRSTHRYDEHSYELRRALVYHSDHPVGPSQWLRRLGMSNLALIEHLDIICDLPVEHREHISRQKLAEFLFTRDVPLPDGPRYLGTSMVKDHSYRFWWPFDSVLPTTARLPLPQVAENSLAYVLSIESM